MVQPGVGVGGHFDTPDYASIIAGLMGQSRSDLAAQGIQDAAQRANAVRRAIIQFGEVPDFTQLGQSWASADLNPETTGLAQQNTRAGLSTTARLAKTHTEALRDIRNALAARGALRSGELGYQLGQEQQNYTTGQYDARQQLTDYLSGVQAAYAESERQRLLAEQQAEMQATLQALAQYPAQWVSDTPPGSGLTNLGLEHMPRVQPGPPPTPQQIPHYTQAGVNLNAGGGRRRRRGLYG